MKWNLEDINTIEDLKKIKNQFVNDETLVELKNRIKTADITEKTAIGNQIKEIKLNAEVFFKKAEQRLEDLKILQQINKEWIDVEIPTEKENSLHPLTIVANRFRQWFRQNSYIEVKMSEVEIDLYNFERLNIPQDHPARDMQDSLYIDNKTLLRTHNTGITARMLELNSNKSFNQFSFGKVYRNDEDDKTHSHQFTQIDFVSVGEVNIANLIWTLKSLLTYVFEEEINIVLRPSFFPFTEPSLEVDMIYKDRVIEILGSGMLHPNVLKASGYTNDMTAFAAGIGIERVTMIKYNIDDIRDLYHNDLRFLKQF